ncbi:IclR family transcriptional regulator [Sinomonas sp. ASV322]|uniref:IclR family transcriptional regulator n=1 Tax=Sinomonas sp. ASV322 TaxID=3041920 RepID=UPI0027DE4262|nr:IclR family transcriptional regulator [Sinomonas sp. ASV322]MDQ4503568.1 IclR family transcriptional regulator [Sinomonas sp. ASV322]
MANSSSGDSVIDRVVRVLEAFPEGVSALPLTELADRAGLPLTSAHRIVSQLALHRLLEQAPGGKIQLGLRLWELVNRNSPILVLRQAALPFMDDIHQVLNQNVNLAVLQGDDVLFVERLSRRGSVANRAKVAGRMPVHISSAGVALMAGQPRHAQNEYLSRFYDPSGRTTVDHVRQLLATAAERGFAELAGVVDPDTWGIAVPVEDRQGLAVAAIGVVVPIAEVRIHQIVPALKTAARGIGRQLAAPTG